MGCLGDLAAGRLGNLAGSLGDLVVVVAGSLSDLLVVGRLGDLARSPSSSSSSSRECASGDLAMRLGDLPGSLGDLVSSGRLGDLSTSVEDIAGRWCVPSAPPFTSQQTTPHLSIPTLPTNNVHAARIIMITSFFVQRRVAPTTQIREHLNTNLRPAKPLGVALSVSAAASSAHNRGAARQQCLDAASRRAHLSGCGLAAGTCHHP